MTIYDQINALYTTNAGRSVGHDSSHDTIHQGLQDYVVQLGRINTSLSTIIPAWQANHSPAYAVGVMVISPNNDVVTATVSSSDAVFDPTKWILSTSYLQQWRPSISYPINYTLLSPNGDVVTSNVANSGASYNRSQWSFASTDPRMGNARTPTSHGSTHNVGGSDAITFPPSGIRNASDYDNSVAPTNGQRLVWNAAAGKFKPFTPPSYRAVRNANQTINSATWQQIVMDQLLLDNKAGAGAGGYYVQVGGTYLLSATTAWYADGRGSRFASVWVNGAALNGASNSVLANSQVQTIVSSPLIVAPLNVGDFVACYAWQNAGVDVATSGANYDQVCSLSIAYQGP